MAKLQTLVRLAEFSNLPVMQNTIAKFDVMDTGSARCLELSWLPTDVGSLIIVQRDAHSDRMFAVTLNCNGTHAPHSYVLPKLETLTHIEVLASCPVTILDLAFATWDSTVTDAMNYAALQVRGSDSFTVAQGPEGNTAFLHCGQYPSVALSIPRVLNRGSFYSFLLKTRALCSFLLPGATKASLQGAICGIWPTSNFATSVARVGNYGVPFELNLAENSIHADTSSGVAYATQRRVINL